MDSKKHYEHNEIKTSLSGTSICVWKWDILKVVLFLAETNDVISQNLNRKNEEKQKSSFACPTCNRKLKTATSLKAHVRTHRVVEKKFECDNCGKKYTNQYDLKVILKNLYTRWTL